jgi:ATP-dependent DNA helicase RecQ
VAHAALDLGDQENMLFQKLRRVRMDLARKHNVAAYMIFTDAALYGIASEQPTTLEQLGEVPGIGARKLNQYGNTMLQAVREWKEQPTED